MTITTTDDKDNALHDRPGAQLAVVRIAKGYAVEDIASRLNLRIRVIELLEADDYSKMPNPVFVKGYLRAYAKLMEVDPGALLETFNRTCLVEQHSEKSPLWQSRRDTGRGERAIRWITTVFGLVVLAAVAIWWQKSQDNQHLFAKTTAEAQKQETKEVADITESEIRLTDLSTMRSLLSSDNQYTSVESAGE